MTEGTVHTITIHNVSFIADPVGALYWPEQQMLIVADLHLEKGSSFARRGLLLPPYDSGTTLHNLSKLITRYAPQRVIALGDSFHDRSGSARMTARDRETLAALQRGRDWIWIAGNHDPEPLAIDGTFVRELAVDGLVFRHEPTGEAGEIAGHLHPRARVRWRGHVVVRRCFAAGPDCVVMPAFGAYTGGLNILDRAFARVFATPGFTAHLLGSGRLYAFPAAHCLG
ncbi:MAG: ligase-associated DNA damage response endonuclease PdeM [Xanthobacteraceae bacterium]|nr:ligase-associated DNA damage response endonuclease PdeM [Xanthobacteraceae bacterium]